MISVPFHVVAIVIYEIMAQGFDYTPSSAVSNLTATELRQKRLNKLAVPSTPFMLEL